jgi:hypothetical protein
LMERIRVPKWRSLLAECALFQAGLSVRVVGQSAGTHDV